MPDAAYAAQSMQAQVAKRASGDPTGSDSGNCWVYGRNTQIFPYINLFNFCPHAKSAKFNRTPNLADLQYLHV